MQCDFFENCVKIWKKIAEKYTELEEFLDKYNNDESIFNSKETKKD
tara:strand:- start:347 stop:484 length:138 start_codon:yes stop_codon:yes gene_type:complete